MRRALLVAVVLACGTGGEVMSDGGADAASDHLLGTPFDGEADSEPEDALLALEACAFDRVSVQSAYEYCEPIVTDTVCNLSACSGDDASAYATHYACGGASGQPTTPPSAFDCVVVAVNGLNADYCCKTRGCTQLSVGCATEGYACAGVDSGHPLQACSNGWVHVGDDVDAGASFWCCN